jgi:hypothetical protein
LQQLHILEASQASSFNRCGLLNGIKLGWYGDDDATTVVGIGIGRERG